MRDYQHAVQLLNSLQSNSATLLKIKSRGNNLNSLPEMLGFLSRIGYKATDLDSLNVIHVAGTKGKGSTCSFVQSILSRSQIDGRKIVTGLYSSPHILEVRERIRINGEPLSKTKFAEYFFNVWDRLEETKDQVEDHLQKPAYFRYMTLMCFHAFKQENVDAAILEVGVGGEYDSTNIVPHPLVTAISSLGLDHQSVLGNTIEEIAWHKAGIIKSSACAISVPQLPTAMEVIVKRVAEKSPLKFIGINTEEINSMKFKLGLAGEHQKINASLAVHVCKEWAFMMNRSFDRVQLSESSIQTGLAETEWPGRCQTVFDHRYPNTCWYLDGAHTPESLEVCSDWFSEIVGNESNGSNAIIFNCTHQRQGDSLFPPMLNVFKLKNITFDMVIFSTNDPFISANSVNGDLINNMVDPDPEMTVQHTLKDTFSRLAVADGVKVGRYAITHTVEEAIQLAAKNSHRTLITGSLHLVGSALTVLVPK